MKNLFNKVDKTLLKKEMLNSKEKRVTLSFYQYSRIKHAQDFRNLLFQKCFDLNVFGRIYVASEGINAQVSVPADRFESFKGMLDEIAFLKDIRLNIAIEDDGKSFFVLKVKVKEKIVADGLDDKTFDVTDGGKHLQAESFNKLVEDPDTVLVDMRNHYESEVGHFQEAICPDVETFRESLPIIEEMLQGKEGKNIVMYCTGGIRCEKASAYYKHKGFKNVYQLDGGIIEYARQVKAQGLENKFLGKNFVFDDRLGERIGAEIISKCHQCGEACDNHVNCFNEACHILFIQCEKCAIKYDETCSDKCSAFIKLPQEEQEARKSSEKFNGTLNGKGRYKAKRRNERL